MSNSVVNDKCLFCLDTLISEPEKLTNITNPKYCNCKIYLHLECLKLIESIGMLCPICRIKTNNNVQILNQINNNEYNEPFIFQIPFIIFNKFPNIFTFMLYLMFSFLITFLYVIPHLLFYAFSNNKSFRYSSITICICILSYYFIVE